MSTTSVLEARSTTRSLFLTPQKKRRLSTKSQKTVPSTTEIYKWVFTSSAVAPCFICDIRVMKHHKAQEEEFWWLKRIPCRSVKIVGLVVGVQTYEKRISYIMDDGTSVIECVHKCGAPQLSPVKGGKKKTISINDPPLPKPVAWIGDTLDIVGRIQEFEVKESAEYSKETIEARRQIQVQEIVRCQSVNDKFRHWQSVLDLHKNHYSLPEPFTIPEHFSVSTPSTSSNPSEISTPSTTSTTSASISSASPSPFKSDTSYQSPRKLRHPSRLHTADLTGNTFRIYIKHYMDNPPISEISDVEFESSDDDDTSTAGLSTPTKRSFKHNETPRCSRRPSHAADETPRAIRPLIYSTSSSRKGFTLSYLRRVPELSELARRVAKAQAKRRDREVRKKAKEAASQRQSHGSHSKAHKTRMSEATIPSTNIGENSISFRMKRLWKWAIVELAQEGSIVLWDGPKYPIAPTLYKHSMHSRIWKLSSSTTVNTTLNSDISFFSSSCERDAEDDIDLSDPDPDEEAYVSLTAELLAGELERVIQTWVKDRRFSDLHRFSKEGILQRLQRDDRWRKVGEWHVEEAIDLLVSKGVMCQISENVWGLSSIISQGNRLQL